MSLHSFDKEAGEKVPGLFLPSDAHEHLLKHIESVSLGRPDVFPEVQDDKITLKGKAGSQEEKEKLILATTRSPSPAPPPRPPKIRHRQGRRQPPGHRRVRVRRCQQVPEGLRGQQADAWPAGQDLPRPGPAPD
ncbi:hypothetical protein ACFYM7_14175 [Streptomyces cyaneofuscatus]|uniref:hypothetical protein n=1 Tax=Streptomyces cyaneofuscatus TaxID=66883 RepID=UPI0036B8A033